ncbi:MAG: hypothetical protein R2845_01760 [Thermomicrobiales bacterium]
MKIGVMFGNPETTTGGNAHPVHLRVGSHGYPPDRDAQERHHSIRIAGACEGGQAGSAAKIPTRPNSTSCTTRGSGRRRA